MRKVVVTGGAGFIGSHIAERCAVNWPAAQIVILDKMTYAADVRNILPLITAGNARLDTGDICDMDACLQAVDGADLVIHAAAESHVDHSFGNSFEFTKTNVLGTHILMEACRQRSAAKIIHVSTDEVYGEVLTGAADEGTLLNPTNPYSASKAAAEMIVNSYRRSFNLPVIILRANNIYGIRQFPEKIIPRFIVSLLTGHPLTLHGNGENIRSFLSARDLVAAVDILIEKGRIGECYNVGTEDEYKNIDTARMICAAFDVNPQDHIIFVENRPFNDARYAVNWKKIAALGWRPRHRLSEDLPDLARWYADHIDRYEAGIQPVRWPSTPARRESAAA